MLNSTLIAPTAPVNPDIRSRATFRHRRRWWPRRSSRSLPECAQDRRSRGRWKPEWAAKNHGAEEPIHHRPIRQRQPRRSANRPIVESRVGDPRRASIRALPAIQRNYPPTRWRRDTKCCDDRRACPPRIRRSRRARCRAPGRAQADRRCPGSEARAPGRARRW